MSSVTIPWRLPPRAAFPTGPKAVAACIHRAEREELHRLIQGLPEEEVMAVLGAAQSRLRTGKDRASLPAWFSADQVQTSDAAARSEDLLEGGFGQPLTSRIWTTEGYWTPAGLTISEGSVPEPVMARPRPGGEPGRGRRSEHRRDRKRRCYGIGQTGSSRGIGRAAQSASISRSSCPGSGVWTWAPLSRRSAW
jgi:hypothetical protein